MYTIYEMCCDGFDQKLEQQFLKPNRHQKKAYVCSPYSNPDLEVQLDNMSRARLYMLYANEHMGYLARAPHAYLPMLVCDGIPTERAMALRFGLELLERSDLLLVCGTTLSKGMKGEITHAAKLGIPIIWYHTDAHPDYHMPSDHAERLNWEKVVDITKASFLAFWKLANEKY